MFNWKLKPSTKMEKYVTVLLFHSICQLSRGFGSGFYSVHCISVKVKRKSKNTHVAINSICAKYSISLISLSKIDGKIKRASTPIAKYSDARILSSLPLRIKSRMKEEKI